jgi:hypothetical protein
VLRRTGAEPLDEVRVGGQDEMPGVTDLLGRGRPLERTGGDAGDELAVLGACDSSRALGGESAEELLQFGYQGLRLLLRDEVAAVLDAAVADVVGFAFHHRPHEVGALIGDSQGGHLQRGI